LPIAAPADRVNGYWSLPALGGASNLNQHPALI
jgi:hypothetical protein